MPVSMIVEQEYATAVEQTARLHARAIAAAEKVATVSLALAVAVDVSRESHAPAARAPAHALSWAATSSMRWKLRYVAVAVAVAVVASVVAAAAWLAAYRSSRHDLLASGQAIEVTEAPHPQCLAHAPLPPPTACSSPPPPPAPPYSCPSQMSPSSVREEIDQRFFPHPRASPRAAPRYRLLGEARPLASWWEHEQALLLHGLASSMQISMPRMHRRPLVT